MGVHDAGPEVDRPWLRRGAVSRLRRRRAFPRSAHRLLRESLPARVRASESGAGLRAGARPAGRLPGDPVARARGALADTAQPLLALGVRPPLLSGIGSGFRRQEPHQFGQQLTH